MNPARHLSMATLLVALGLGSCDKANTEPRPAAPVDAGPDHGAGGHDAQAPVDASAGKDGAPGGTDGAAGASPDAGDPGWKPVQWGQGCLDVATKPADAVPELVWTDCGAGCARLVPNWPNKSGVPLQTAQVFKSGTVLRVGLHLWYGELGQWRKAIYDENMKPLVAWRGDDKCGGNLLQWTPKHVCLSVGPPLDPTIEAYLSPGDLTGNPIAVYATQPFVPLSCNEELFIGSSLGGIPYLRDLGTNLARWIQFSQGQATDPVPVGPHAFFVLMGYDDKGEKVTGWVWKRPDTLEQLVDAGSEMVYDIRGDGNTLVWVQTTSTSTFDVAPGTLWTSPFATSVSEVHGTARRAVPSISLAPSTKAASQGYYAFVEVSPAVSDYDRFLHVYRLSDAHHWKLPSIPDVLPADVIFLDAEEVWYLGTTLNGARSTIIRQRLDALGPGD